MKTCHTGSMFVQTASAGYVKDERTGLVAAKGLDEYKQVRAQMQKTLELQALRDEVEMLKAAVRALEEKIK